MERVLPLHPSLAQRGFISLAPRANTSTEEAQFPALWKEWPLGRSSSFSVHLLVFVPLCPSLSVCSDVFTVASRRPP